MVVMYFYEEPNEEVNIFLLLIIFKENESLNAFFELIS